MSRESFSYVPPKGSLSRKAMPVVYGGRELWQIRATARMILQRHLQQKAISEKILLSGNLFDPNIISMSNNHTSAPPMNNNGNDMTSLLLLELLRMQQQQQQPPVAAAVASPTASTAATSTTNLLLSLLLSPQPQQPPASSELAMLQYLLNAPPQPQPSTEVLLARALLGTSNPATTTSTTSNETSRMLLGILQGILQPPSTTRGANTPPLSSMLAAQQATTNNTSPAVGSSTSSTSTSTGASVSPPPPPPLVAVKQEQDRKSDDPHRFTDKHKNRWMERFLELKQFVQENGHANVPIENYTTNPALSHWVKRQRYQKKAQERGQSSTLTPERQRLLESVDFVWNSHTASWQQRLQELIQFRTQFGHCNVPTKYAANQSLAVWVKCQRRQYQLWKKNKACHMNAKRCAQLEKLGFVWQPRQQHKA